jgi:hypothetical protein
MTHAVPVSDGGTFDRRDTDKIVDKGELTETYVNPELPLREPGEAVDASGETVGEYAHRATVNDEYPDPNGIM